MTTKDASGLLREAHGLRAAGRLDEAIGRYGEALAGGHGGSEAWLALARCELALGRIPQALESATRANRLAPQEFLPQTTLVEALLAAGEARRAADLAGDIRRRWSTSQYAIALQATAWRMMGDRRYRQLCDYDTLIRTSPLDVPAGWSSLETYLADLAIALKATPARHDMDLRAVSHPALRALPHALDGPIRRGLASLGSGDDPARARNRGAFAIQGVLPRLLQPGAPDPDHVRPNGWLSAACFVETAEKNGGGLRFGKPGVRTSPPLEADHHIDPKPGLLVLFPSYMWSGMAPLAGSKPQLSLAFDLAPGAVELPDID